MKVKEGRTGGKGDEREKEGEDRGRGGQKGRNEQKLETRRCILLR